MITVSTRSRAEVAAGNLAVRILAFGVSTHSRAEAAAGTVVNLPEADTVSTHSRAEAAALLHCLQFEISYRFNTQPRGGGCFFQKF